jgi:hypothetical protein
MRKPVFQAFLQAHDVEPGETSLESIFSPGIFAIFGYEPGVEKKRN